MIYFTVKQNEYAHEITWLDLLEDKEIKQSCGSAGTYTRCLERPTDKMLAAINVDKMIQRLKTFNEQHQDLLDADKSRLYRHFTVPKKTGGERPIDAPCERLQNTLSELKHILSDEFGVLYHTSAYAYIPKRSITQALYKHQVNESNWFLKTDFSGFFPSTTLNYTMDMLSMIFPLSEICKSPVGYAELRKALSLAFLNGGLPQGTTLSPWLTNAICIPLDHRLYNELAKHRYVYTRYADDIHISCIQKFDPDKMVHTIEQVLKELHAPYTIKPEKTHFGSRKGSNFMLGLILNADNDIKIGHEKKQVFKAMTSNLIQDWKHGEPWPMHEVRYYDGLRAYYGMVEPDYIKNLISRYNTKYGVNLYTIIKQALGTY